MSKFEHDNLSGAPNRQHFVSVNGNRPLILIVDDLPENLAALSEIVRQAGAEVRVANCGEAALRYAQLEPYPDLILLDIMMPGMDGHAVLAELGNNENTCDIPVIFVTALDDSANEQHGLEEGAADYVTKPIKPAVLITRVNAQLELKQSRDRQSRHKRWLEDEVKRRNDENAQLELKLQIALAAAGFGIWEIDQLSGRSVWNTALCTIFGLEKGPESVSEFLLRVHPEDRPLVESAIDRLQTDTGMVLAEYRVRHQDGRWIWIEGRGKTIYRDASGKSAYSLGTMTDISLRKSVDTERQLAGIVLQGASDGICITDPQRNILMVNESFSRVTGYTLDELLGQNPRILKSDVHGPDFYRDVWDTINLYGNWQGEITNRRKDGSLFKEWLSISAVKNSAGVLTYYIGIFNDLSERHAAAARIQYLSNYDSLTGLPNRNLFADRLEQSLLNARRFGRGTAVFLLDLDHFRRINDTLGSPAGDGILIEVARRLGLQVREGDTVGHRSGNEFGFIMASLGHERDTIALAQRLLEAIAVPLVVNEQSLVVTASIGISVAPKNGSSSQDLLKSADMALMRAKQAGRNTFRFYSPDMDVDAARRLGLEAALRLALEHNELSVHYQPQISLDSGRILGVEALLRWNSAQFGAVAPLEFIPIAEENGLIIPLGEWVLRTACRQAKSWLDLDLLPLRVAVNLSARQFRQPNLVAVIRDALAQSTLPPAALELEITESAFIDDVEQAVAICRDLKTIGIKLSLDDFGTGYSSLAYISRFPFDKLKIDQGFIRDIIENPVNAAITTAAIVMARSLNLTVVAEGVETEAQSNFLRGRRCDAMQGYLFSHPLTADQFSELLQAKKSLPLFERPPESAQTLLLLDDEPSILTSLTRLLRREGYAILTAETPAEAFEKLARQPVQVIISDQRMPEMSGTEFLARVRRLYPDTIRMVLTGYTDLDSVTGAINRGAIYKFLTKPWDEDQLREHIREAFRAFKETQSRAQLPLNPETGQTGQPPETAA